MRRVPLLRARYFFWMVVPIAGYAAVSLFGTPHVIWSYQYPSGRYVDASARYHTSCTYVGMSGSIRRTPTSGQCPLIAFEKAKR